MGMYNEEYLCKSCWHRFLETKAYCDKANMLCPKCKSNLFEPIDDIEIDWLINILKDLTRKYYNKLAEYKQQLDEVNFMRTEITRLTKLDLDKLDEIKKKLKERFDEEFYKKCVTTEEVARKTVFNIIEECFQIRKEKYKCKKHGIKRNECKECIGTAIYNKKGAKK